MSYNNDHSGEVREIMGRQANWMVRWAAVLLVLIVAIVAGVFLLISYPVFISVPIQMETATITVSDRGVAGEAAVSEAAYARIEAGQEVHVKVSSAAVADHEIIGRIDSKLPGRRVRLVFPTGADQQNNIRSALPWMNTAKIKTGEKRLITQFSSLFVRK